MRNFVLSCLCLLGFALPAPTWAAEAASPEEEIVYRANLGRADDIKLLLDQGLSANQTDEKGVPLLCLASGRVDKESVNVINMLLDSGANVDAQDTNGQNALFYAAKRGNKEAVQLLLERKINYYAVDNNGDIARTIAFREGHNDIVTQMDNFVKGETQKISEQYRELSKLLEQQYKAQEEESKKVTTEAMREALEKNRKLHEDEEQRSKATAQQEAEQVQEIIDKRNSEDFTQAQYNLSFNACAFEYWTFCQAAKQTTDLKEAELAKAIASHKEQTLTRGQQMLATYSLRKKFTDRIINDSRHSINRQLAAMPSKTYRFEHGVCKMPDMIKRCEDIAENGGQSSALYAPQAQSTKKSGKQERSVDDIRKEGMSGRSAKDSKSKSRKKSKRHR